VLQAPVFEAPDAPDDDAELIAALIAAGLL